MAKDPIIEPFNVKLDVKFPSPYLHRFAAYGLERQRAHPSPLQFRAV